MINFQLCLSSNKNMTYQFNSFHITTSMEISFMEIYVYWAVQTGD